MDGQQLVSGIATASQDVTPSDGESRVKTVLRADDLEVIRATFSAGETVDTHSAPGPILVQCLAGTVSFRLDGTSSEINSGDLFYIPPRKPHAITSVTDSALLLTFPFQRPAAPQRRRSPK